VYRQFGYSHYRNGFSELGHDRAAIAQSGQLDALVALECIGTRVSFLLNDEIYDEGDGSDSGTRSSRARSGSANFSPMAGAISPSSALVAITLVWTAAANVSTRARRWMT
jgi:hypothetical protein